MPVTTTAKKIGPRRTSPDLRARERAARLVLAAYAADNRRTRAAVRAVAVGRRRDLVRVLWLVLGIAARLLRNPSPNQAEAEIKLVVADLTSDR